MLQYDSLYERYLVEFHNTLKSRWLNPERVFALADTNNDGKIDIKEFRSLLADFGISIFWEQPIEGFFSHFDTSGDGQIDSAEFQSKMNHASQLASDRQKYHRFSLVPVSKNTKYISLVAHNEMKQSLIKFVEDHRNFFGRMPLVTTGSTGKAMTDSLGIPVEKLVASGPLGGDQAIGGLISEHRIAAIFFFKDPLSAHPHAADIEALTRLCDVHQVPYATNSASAVGLLMALRQFGLHWEIDYEQNSALLKYSNRSKD
ncbi:MAG: methylglyoxal synthase [Cyanobacteria bacterium J06623_7]